MYISQQVDNNYQTQQNQDLELTLQNIVQQRSNIADQQFQEYTQNQDFLQEIIIGFSNSFQNNVIVEIQQQRTFFELKEIKMSNNIKFFVLQQKIRRTNDIILKIKNSQNKSIYYESKFGTIKENQKVLLRWLKLDKSSIEYQKDFLLNCIEYMFKNFKEASLYFKSIQDFDKILEENGQTKMELEIDDIFDKDNQVDQINFLIYFVGSSFRKYNNQINFKEQVINIIKQNLQYCLESSYYQTYFDQYKDIYISMLRCIFHKEKIDEEVFKEILLNEKRIGMQIYLIDFATGFEKEYFSPCLVSHIVSVCDELSYYTKQLKKFLLVHKVNIVQATVYLDSKLKKTKEVQRASIYRESIQLFNEIINCENDIAELEEYLYLFDNYQNFEIITQEILSSDKVTEFLINQIFLKKQQDIFIVFNHISQMCPTNFLFCKQQIQELFLKYIVNNPDHQIDNMSQLCSKLFDNDTKKKFLDDVIQSILQNLKENNCKSANRDVVKAFALDITSPGYFEEQCKKELKTYFIQKFQYKQELQEYYLQITRQNFSNLEEMKNDEIQKVIKFQSWIQELSFDKDFLQQKLPQENNNEISYSEDQKRRIRDLKKKKENLQNQNIEKEEHQDQQSEKQDELGPLVVKEASQDKNTSKQESQCQQNQKEELQDEKIQKQATPKTLNEDQIDLRKYDIKRRFDDIGKTGPVELSDIDAVLLQAEIVKMEMKNCGMEKEYQNKLMEGYEQKLQQFYEGKRQLEEIKKQVEQNQIELNKMNKTKSNMNLQNQKLENSQKEKLRLECSQKAKSKNSSISKDNITSQSDSNGISNDSEKDGLPIASGTSSEKSISVKNKEKFQIQQNKTISYFPSKNQIQDNNKGEIVNKRSFIKEFNSENKENLQNVQQSKNNYQYLAGNVCQQISFLYQNFVFFNSLMVTDYEKAEEKLLVVLDNNQYVKKKNQQKKFTYKYNQHYLLKLNDIKSRLQKNQLLYNSIKKQIDFFPIYDFDKNQKICVTKIANNKIDFKYSLINYVNYDFIIQQFQSVFFLYILDFEDFCYQRCSVLQQMQEFFVNFYNDDNQMDFFQKRVIIYITGTINTEQQKMFTSWIQNNENYFLKNLNSNIVFAKQQNLDSIVRTCFKKDFMKTHNSMINMYFYDSQIDPMFNYLRQFEQQIFQIFQNFSIHQLEFTFNNLSIILDIFLKSIDHTIYESFLKPITQIWLFILYVYLKIFLIYGIKSQPTRIQQSILENVKVLDIHDNFLKELISQISELNFQQDKNDLLNNTQNLVATRDEFIKQGAKTLKKEIEAFFGNLYDNAKIDFQGIIQRYNDGLKSIDKNATTSQYLTKVSNQIEIAQMLHQRLKDIIYRSKISIYEFVYNHNIYDLQNFQTSKQQITQAEQISDDQQKQEQKVLTKETQKTKITLEQAIKAIQQNDEQTLESFLLQDPYNVKLQDQDKKTLFYHVVFNNAPQCTQLVKKYNDMLKTEETVDINPFELLVKKNYDELEMLAAQNIDLDCFKQIDSIHNSRVNLLMFSVFSDNIQAFRFLIQVLKLNVNAQNEQGEAVIHICCLLKKENFLNLLINHENCDYNIKKNDGKTPLYICVESNYLQGVNLLQAREVNLKERFENENTLYHVCVVKQYFEVLQILLQNVNSVDYKNDDGDTPFHIAIKQQKLPFIDILISRSNLELKDSQDNTPLIIAFNLKNMDIITKLIENKANVNKKTATGKTLIHMAVEQNWIELVRLLIRCNAQINKQDENGNTPLHLAYKKFNKKIIQLLEHNEANNNAKNELGLLPKQMKPLIRPDMFKVKEKKIF